MTDNSPPTFRAPLSRVRKMFEAVSCALSRYVRTFLRLRARPDEAAIARDRSFSEADIGIRKSASRDWPRSNSFSSLSLKTQLTHISLGSLATSSLMEDNLLSISRHGSKGVAIWNVSPMSNLEVPEVTVRSETPKYLGYGKKYDNIPWITTPRSLTASEQSGENSSSSPFSKKSGGKSPLALDPLSDNDSDSDSPEDIPVIRIRPTTLYFPSAPECQMSQRDLCLYKLRQIIWANLYWQAAIQWEEDHATIRDIFRRHEELERDLLRIPALERDQLRIPELERNLIPELERDLIPELERNLFPELERDLLQLQIPELERDLFPGLERDVFPGLERDVFPGLERDPFPGLERDPFPGLEGDPFPGLERDLRQIPELERDPLKIPEINLQTDSPLESPNDPKSTENECQSENSSKFDLPDITISFSDDLRTSPSSLSTTLSDLPSGSNVQDSSSTSLRPASTSFDNSSSQNDENWACFDFDEVDLVEYKIPEKLQTLV